MTDSKIKLLENYGKEFGSLNPTIYSSKKFIDFIKRFLLDQGGLESNTYEFEAGNKIAIETQSLGPKKTRVTVSYNDGKPPSASVSNFNAEYGKEFAAQEIAIDVEITRASYPLKFIEWTEGITPTIEEDRVALAGLQFNQKYNSTVKNSNPIGPNATIIATNGKFEDVYGQGGNLESRINRKARNFWGSIANEVSSYNVHDSNWSSQLGGLPSEIEIQHGATPTHFIIVTTENIEVFAQGLKVGVTKLTEVPQNPYKSNLSYTKPYNVYISTARSTGNYTYMIKNA